MFSCDWVESDPPLVTTLCRRRIACAAWVLVFRVELPRIVFVWVLAWLWVCSWRLFSRLARFESEWEVVVSTPTLTLVRTPMPTPTPMRAMRGKRVAERVGSCSNTIEGTVQTRHDIVLLHRTWSCNRMQSSIHGSASKGKVGWNLQLFEEQRIGCHRKRGACACACGRSRSSKCS